MIMNKSKLIEVNLRDLLDIRGEEKNSWFIKWFWF